MKTRSISILFLCAVGAFADSIPRPAGGTFARGALYTVAGYEAGRPALSGFPVLVRIANGTPAGFAYEQLQSPLSGADLAFVYEDGSGLPFEIETWNPFGTSLVWVRLPSMRNGTKFAMCWGSATGGKAVCGDNPWTGYAGVWHLDETGAGAVAVADTSTNALSGTAHSESVAVSDSPVGGGRGLDKDGKNGPAVTVAAAGTAIDSLPPSFAVSGWFRPHATTANWGYLFSRKSSDGYASWGLQFRGNNGDYTTTAVYSNGTSDKNNASFDTKGKFAQGTWAKYDAVYDGTTVAFYVDGALIASKPANPGAAVNGELSFAIGGLVGTTGHGSLKADHDEVRLAAFAPTADWVAADYATQKNADFLTAGAAEDIDMDAPAGLLSVTGADYTGAGATIRVYSLGTGASSATALVEVSAAADFSSVAWSQEIALAGAVATNVAASGLEPGKSYWMRASVTNDIGGVLSLGPASFATATPGAPEGTAEFGARGFTTLSATGTATAFGEGASSATMRLEAATDADFTTLAGVSAEVPAAVDAATELEIGNLEPGTEYRLRMRLVNNWGIETFVELPRGTTLDGPFDAADLRWTFSENVTEASVFLDVTAVFAGASGTATLYCDEGEPPTVSRGGRTVDAAGTVSWAGIPFGDEPLNAEVVLVSEVDGTTYTQTWKAVVDVGFKRPKLLSVDETLAYRTDDAGNQVEHSFPGSVFDGDFSTGLKSVRNGEAVVVDFTSLFDSAKPNQRMYVDHILVAHGSECPYSIFVSTDGTDWTAVEAAQNAAGTGTSSYTLKNWVSKVKYVAEATLSNNSAPLLSELQIFGYISDSPHKVSKWQLAWIYDPDGTPREKDGSDPTQPNATGGGSYMKNLFNGNFGDNVYIGPNGRLAPGSFAMLDFTSEALDGYSITEIRTGSMSEHSYSLYYSADGTVWKPVGGGTGVKAVATKSFAVNDIARYVKCVFDEIGGWTPSFNELEVWGLDAKDAACVHPTWTPWATVEGSATCLDYGYDVQHCTVCGERAVRENHALPPLGHDYRNKLDVAGKYRGFGRGSIECSRCTFHIDCPEPVDLVTNKVDGEPIAVVRSEGLIRFTNVSVSSTGDTAWGIRPGHLIGNTWGWAWNNYWYSLANDSDPHVDFEFGTTVDLTWIDLSVQNATNVFRFYGVDPDTGAETQLKKFLVVRTDPALGDRYHIYRGSDDEPEDLYGEEELDELFVAKDSGIPTRKHDAEGAEIPDNPNTDSDEGSNDYNQYQRFTVRFFEQPVKILRIRQFMEDGATLAKPAYISEIHPWGTVRGAGDLRYRKETLLILR